jgi:hypothetical protein
MDQVLWEMSRAFDAHPSNAGEPSRKHLTLDSAVDLDAGTFFQ